MSASETGEEAGRESEPGLSPPAVALLATLFCGLLLAFGALTLAARGHGAWAGLAAASGLAVVAGSAILLHRRADGA